MNYVERHFGDWARDTLHLSMLEEGAYNRLVDLYYVREAPLPNDLTACYRLARAMTGAERAAVKSVLSEFFHQTDAGWAHKRCDREIDRFRTKSGKASASAKARWNASRNVDATPNANASAKAVRHARAATSSQAPLPTEPLPTSQSSQAELAVGGADKPRATRKPPREFAVTAEMRAWAMEKTPLVLVDTETEKFRDHTFANAIADWPGAWRNWLRKANDFAASRGNGKHHPMSTEDRDAEAMRLLGIGDAHA